MSTHSASTHPPTHSHLLQQNLISIEAPPHADSVQRPTQNQTPGRAPQWARMPVRMESENPVGAWIRGVASSKSLAFKSSLPPAKKCNLNHQDSEANWGL